VRFAFGCDGIRDPWWPYGSGDMLERAFLVAFRNGLRTDPELSGALAGATTVGAELLGLGPYGVTVGARADLVLVDAECGPEAVAAHPPRLGVIKGGRVVSWTTPSARALGAPLQ
jgi:cytosine/creatinine deaminase